LAQKPIDTIVGERLTATRTARNVSQAQLAIALGITEAQIAGYEAGTDRIPAEHLIAMCQFFRIPLADLFPRSDPPVH
jgi:transcriptional regulator with XRE-family HTH domain